jgi:hypothetical protein
LVKLVAAAIIEQGSLSAKELFQGKLAQTLA